MDLDKITPLIITFNEEDNLERVLDRLTWASQIIIIDSYSSDSTVSIITKYPNITLYQNPFESFAQQCNYGLGLVNTPYVLSVDSDYLITNELIEEIEKLDINKAKGFSINFKYCVDGKPLSGTILPPRTCLYEKAAARYVDDGHAHRVKIDGEIGILKNYIWHDDRKPLSRWLSSQDKYMVLEVKKLFSGHKLSLSDRIRKKIFFAPLLIFFYCLIVKRGFLDGKRGWYYAYQRMLAECLLSLRIIEYHFGNKKEV